jgi:hypothetical protein
MNNNTRYQIHEGSIDLPHGFQDRSTNIFMHGDPKQSRLNLNIARDTLEPDETLAMYIDRQIRLLEKNIKGYRLATRQAAQLGSGSDALAGECIEAARKEGGQTFYQRQAAFLCGPDRALILSATAPKPFTGELETLWAAWLASFRPAAS